MNYKKKQNNCLYLVSKNELWEDLIIELRKTHNYKPKVIISGNKFKKIKKYFWIHSLDALIGKFPKIKLIPLDETLIKFIGKFEPIIHQMISRHLKSKFLSNYEERRNFVFIVVSFFNSVLLDKKIDIIILHSNPHRVYDYILYILSKYHNLKILFPTKTAIPGLHDFSHGTSEKFKFDKSSKQVKILPRVSKFISLSVKNFSEARIQYSKEISSDSSYFKRGGIDYKPFSRTNQFFYYLNKIYKYFSSYFSKKKNIMFEINSPNFFLVKRDHYFSEIKSYSNIKKANKWYIENSISPNFKKEFLIIFMPYQPEVSSVPYSGNFYDLGYVIKFLENIIPKKYSIYVKEHPRVFKDFPYYNSSRSKDEYIYALKQSSRVKFIDFKTDSKKLILKSKGLVSYADGTSTFEALSLLKPVLCFNKTFTAIFKNSYSIYNRDDIKKFLQSLDKNLYMKSDFVNDVIKLQIKSNNLTDYFKYMMSTRTRGIKHKYNKSLIIKISNIINDNVSNPEKIFSNF
jgi:hypothetical protein